MSKSYPKSSIWPFVLSGVLLFGLVINPPSKIASQIRQLVLTWSEGQGVGPVHVSVTPKVVPNDPWRQRPSSADHDIIYSEIAPAPTWNVAKESFHTAELLAADDLSEPAIRGAPGDHLADAPQADCYVWQPPKDWVPTLIEPLDVPTHAAQEVVKSATRALTLAPISEPVAKLDTLQRPPRQNRSLPDLQPPQSLAPISEPELDETNPDERQGSSSTDPIALDGTPKPAASEPSNLPGPKRSANVSRYLTSLLRAGIEQPRLKKWSRQLLELVEAFRSETIRGDDRQRQIVQLLSQLANYPVDVGGWTVKEQEYYWRIRHAVQRRTDVWRPLLAVAAEEAEFAARNDAQTRAMANKLLDRFADDPATAVWCRYLQLDQLATSPRPHQAAEHTLLRLRSRSLTPEQRSFLATAEFDALEDQLRATISAGISAQNVVDALEAYEDDADTQSAKALLATLQRFANGVDSERYSPAVRAIDTHYRNANVRMSISEDLINRLVPAMHQYAEQVNDTILGAKVRGQNATRTNLSVQLVPDAKAIRLQLLAQGHVQSNTASRKGPVVFYNRGQSQFAAGKSLVITADGISVGQTETSASTGNRVIGMRSDWDQVPLVGAFIRYLARQRHAEQRPFLRSEVLRRVRRNTTTKLDGEVQRRVAAAEDRVQSRVVQPLRRMELDPRAMEMRTTEDRAILRTRLAGPLQLGSHTPRPRALSTSKLSFQIHQTAANNLIDQLQLGGRSMTLGELAGELSSRVGLELQIPEKRQATIVEFAHHRPIEFDFQDGRVEITIHFAKLDNGRDQWSNFSVRGYYRADARQLDVELLRDGSIELITESVRLRDQIALRGIFTKVFDTHQRVDLLQRAIQDQPRLRSLEVSQLTIRDGWISVSIGERDDSRIRTAETSAAIH